jgi:F-type H+-transporting ATPase subunit a
LTLFAASGFPPLTHITHWPDFALKNTAFGMNKIFLIYVFAVVLTMLVFILGNKKQMVPGPAQNLAEMAVDFIEEGVVKETMGEDGLKYTPILLSIFFFVFFTNIFEIVPIIQMPASARVALPLTLALFTYVVFNYAGIRSHGLFGYFKHMLVPPGVPVGLLPIIIPIEFVSNFLVRPFSLMVRLFANLLAGHILLVTFTVLSASLWTAKWYAVFLPLPVFGVIFFVAFEILVSFLQAYVFALLTGVYIHSAASHEH